MYCSCARGDGSRNRRNGECSPMFVAPFPDVAARFLAPVQATCARFHIDGRQQVAAFLAQAAHESGNFARLEEDLTYTTASRILAVWPRRFAGIADAAAFVRRPDALANRVYANRLGNGDEASGDGARFRGRGLFQLTGRANYMAAGDALSMPYKARPETVALPEHAALTAAWFWATTGCNAAANTGDFDRTTRLINGAAMLGADERRAKYAAVLGALT